jgi:hypothetical protein|nr:MAG TPA: replisome organizer [Caudoviricetes sp.]
MPTTDMDKGFIMLSRKLFSHRIWKASRTFSECEAWIDLIQSARFEATQLKASIGGREITYGRGQYPASISFLSKKWKWDSEKKVRNFLDMLKRDGMITTDASQGMNVITLCNYDLYNPINIDKGEDKGKGNGIDIEQEIKYLKHSLGELRASLGASDENKGQGKGKNNNKDNNNIPPTPKSGGAVTSVPDTGDNPETEKEKTWKDDFSIYLDLVRSAYKSICDDPKIMETQQSYYPGVNIKLSLEKACTNFWATDAGWKHKKKSRAKEIDMRMTLINAIDKNKVYYGKNEHRTDLTYIVPD